MTIGVGCAAKRAEAPRILRALIEVIEVGADHASQQHGADEVVMRHLPGGEYKHQAETDVQPSDIGAANVKVHMHLTPRRSRFCEFPPEPRKCNAGKSPNATVKLAATFVRLRIICGRVVDCYFTLHRRETAKLVGLF